MEKQSILGKMCRARVRGVWVRLEGDHQLFLSVSLEAREKLQAQLTEVAPEKPLALFMEPDLVQLTALHLGPFAEDLLHRRAQRLRAIQHEQVTPLRVDPARHQVFQQRLHYGGVAFCVAPLPKSQHVLRAVFFQAQRHDQRLAGELDSIDQQRQALELPSSRASARWSIATKISFWS